MTFNISRLLFFCFILSMSHFAKAQHCEPLLASSIGADIVHPSKKNVIFEMLKRSVNQRVESSAQTEKNSRFKPTKALLSLLRSAGYDEVTSQKYVASLSTPQANALASAIRSYSDYHYEFHVLKVSQKLKAFGLFEEAAYFYQLGLQFYKAAQCFRENLGRKDLGDALLNHTGLGSGIDETKGDLVDRAGKAYLSGDGARLMLTSWAEMSDQQADQILSRFKKVTSTSPEAPSVILKTPYDPSVKFSIQAKEAGVAYIQTMISHDQFFTQLKKTGYLRTPGNAFYASVHPKNYRGAQLEGGHSIFGGPYKDGETLYIIFKPDILDRNDFQATPSWNTQGKALPTTVFSSDRPALFEYFTGLMQKSAAANEIVFQNKEEDPVSIDFIKEIWVHPFYRDAIIEQLGTAGINPPQNASWESIIRGVFVAP